MKMNYCYTKTALCNSLIRNFHLLKIQDISRRCGYGIRNDYFKDNNQRDKIQNILSASILNFQQVSRFFTSSTPDMKLLNARQSSKPERFWEDESPKSDNYNNPVETKQNQKIPKYSVKLVSASVHLRKDNPMYRNHLAFTLKQVKDSGSMPQQKIRMRYASNPNQQYIIGARLSGKVKPNIRYGNTNILKQIKEELMEIGIAKEKIKSSNENRSITFSADNNRIKKVSDPVPVPNEIKLTPEVPKNASSSNLGNNCSALIVIPEKHSVAKDDLSSKNRNKLELKN